MTQFFKNSLIVIFYLLVTTGSSGVTAKTQAFCSGQIVEILKWSDHDNISILIEGSRRYLQMPTSADRAMALMAFEQKMTVKIQWRSSSLIEITDCKTDWSHYEVLDGFISVSR